MLANGWKISKLEELATINMGQSPPSETYNEEHNGIPFYQGVVDFNRKFTTPRVYCSRPIKIANEGDVLLSVRAPVGRINITKLRCSIGRGNAALRMNNGEQEFLYYLLSILGNSFDAVSSGTVFTSINKDVIKNIKVQVPQSKDEQSRIASILSSLDDKIELTLQMNKTLEAIAQEIFKEWFVDYRFPGFDGVLVDGLPNGWRKGSLGENFNITMGQSPPGESYNDTGEGTIFFQGRTDFGFRFPENRMYTTSPNRLAKKLDTLVSVRAPVGDINMALEDCCIGRGLSSVRHNSGAYSFTYYAIRSLENIFKGFDGEGTIFGSINKTNFENISTVAPAEEVIMGFESVVNTLDEKIFNNSKEIRTLTELRDSLLPRLMTGKIRVA